MMLATYFQKLGDCYPHQAEVGGYCDFILDHWSSKQTMAEEDTESIVSSRDSGESQFLNCGICMGRFVNPKMLPCLHTFCERCLLQYAPPASLTLSCPVCRQQSILPKQGVSGLQNNFFINNLMDVLEQASVCAICQVKSNGGSNKCLECNQHLCNRCCVKHVEDPSTSLHSIVTVEDNFLFNDDDNAVNNHSGQNSEKKNNLLTCPKHINQSLRFYCKECETAICVTCTDIEHAGHMTARLAEAVKDEKSNLRELLKKAYDHVPTLKEAIETVSNVTFSLANNHEKNRLLINDCFNSLEEALHQRRNELIEELDQMASKKRTVLEEQKNLLNMCLSNLMANSEFTENALCYGSETEIILVTKQMVEKLEDFAAMRIQKMPEENDYLTFRPEGFDTAKTAISNVGNLMTTSAVAHQSTAAGEGLKLCRVNKQTLVVVTAKDRRSDIVRGAGDVFEAELVSPELNFSCKPKIVDQKNGSYDMVYTVPKEGTYHLSIKFLGQHISGSPFVVKSYIEEESSSSDRPVSSKIPRTTGVRQRTSKSSSSNRSSGSRLRSNAIEDDLILKVGNRGRGRGEFSNPQGVCCTRDGRIVIADSNNQCVQVFDAATGEFRLRFGARGRSPGQMQRPTGVTILSNGNFAVADYENKWVSIYDPYGKYLSRIGIGKLLGPKGVAVDRNGHIIVVDNKGNNVLVFQENGKILYKFGSRPSEPGRFTGPHYAAINSRNQIVVSDFHSHCVKIFDAEGGFLSSFGSNGEGNGQFNAPTGVAIDSQDNIIVADWGNCRIQVFDMNGSFLSFINTFGDPLYGPQGLALTPDGHVVVSDSGNHCFKVYKYLQ
ncbi:tripartite motif-containing protein 2-like isoform X2 [Argiope bruennichi]|uniref:tripartite motif-containing protein 2-like isoform X2 n=1 Tax=Argiope bruennichi TaxID=94029 RepID=UPI002494567A|nr:tripartite motif-containing protein 2-like isoform X2 [Argiope bruennichi]